MDFILRSSNRQKELSEIEIDIKKILLPEDEVIFKIIDIFSELNEKKTEFMRMNINDFFGESYLAEVRKNMSNTPSSPSSALNMSQQDPSTRQFTENQDRIFIPKLKGIPITNYNNPSQTFLARSNTCPLLKKIGITIDMILGYCPIGGPLFFPLLTDQLSILERFLSTSTSRIIMSEIIDKLLQALVTLKCLFIRLHDTEVRDTINKTVSHRNSPRRYFREEKPPGYPSQAQGNK